MKKIILLLILGIISTSWTFAQNQTIQNNTQSITILPASIKTNRPSITGVNNTNTGNNALKSNTSGTENTAVGENALYQNASGSYNTAIGSNSQFGTIGTNNTSIGSYSLYVARFSTTNNTAIGSISCVSCNGNNNTALGYGSLTNNTGNDNTAIGTSALHNNQVFYGYGSYAGGSNNTAVGSGTLSNSLGNNNTAVGYHTLTNLVSASDNTAMGNNALLSNNNSGNTAVGSGALYSNATGSNNVVIGYQAGYFEATSDKLYIANSATTNPLIGGDFANGIVGIGMNVANLATNPSWKLQVLGDINAMGSVRAAGVVLTSDKRFKKDILPLENSLAKIMKLDGVSYHWRTKEFPDRKFSDTSQIGFIAQDIEKIYPELVQTDAQGYKSVNYVQLTPVLVEGIKTLNNKVEALEKENAILKANNAKIAKLADKIEALEALLQKNTEIKQNAEK